MALRAVAANGGTAFHRRGAMAWAFVSVFGIGRASAQVRTRPYRLGILHYGRPGADSFETQAFFDELASLGFVEGKNLVIDRRYSGGDRAKLDALAVELVALKPDAIYTVAGRLGGLAAKRATSTIPIVFDATNDPVSVGLVASLARPGGNVTGNVLFGISLDPKRMQILVEATGKPKSIAHLDEKLSQERLEPIRSGFDALGLSGARLDFYSVEKVGDLKGAFEQMSRDKVDALVIGASAFTIAEADMICDLVMQYRIPAIAEGRRYAERGLLLTYSTDFVEVNRRAAGYIAKILNGADPASLPAERVTKFNLTVNLRTAKALGLRVPSSLLLRADSIIE